MHFYSICTLFLLFILYTYILPMFKYKYGQLWQWDYNIILDICGHLPMDERRVHFAQSGSDEIYSVSPVGNTVKIPNILLTEPKTINVYAWVEETPSRRTWHCDSFKVNPRPKPPEYDTEEIDV